MARVRERAKTLIRSIHQEKGSVALDRDRNWQDARRPSRINYYSYWALIEEVRSADFNIEGVRGFRIFRNRIRAMTRLEDYRWYFRLISYLTRTYPYLASDVMVVGRKRPPGAAATPKTRIAA